MSIVTEKLITAEELLAMGDIGSCELIYGKIVMMSPAGMEHGAIAARIVQFLRNFVDHHNLGEVFTSEAGFKMASDPDLVRAPDVSFVTKSRLDAGITKGFFDGPPDLAVEIIPPRDSRIDVVEKVKMWLAHGTSCVWVCNPADMTITIHRLSEKPERLTITDELRGDSVLQGFTAPIARIFKRP